MPALGPVSLAFVPRTYFVASPQITMSTAASAPELVLPGDLSEADALELLQSGVEGRFALEARLNYAVCTIGGCLLPSSHQGMCRTPNYGHGRKKTARKVFEIDEGAPQHSGSANPKRTRKPAALVPKATTSASVEDPELERDHSWANGPRGQASLEVLERAIDLVPNMRAAPSFLGTNAQAHPNPFSPIADLMDNGIEAGASEMRISLHKLRGEPMLTMTDDGRGMTERSLLDGPLSLCYTSKHGTHYGMGATTSIPAISGFCLLFSVTAGGHRTVGFLSSKLSAKVQASQTKMPQCTWTATAADGSSALLATKGAEAPLGLEARRASLQVILEFSPYATEAALLDVFAGEQH